MKHRDQILKLRAEGKTYDEIKEITGASKGTISFHCGKGQKEKSNIRQTKYRVKLHPFAKKMENFQSNKMLEKHILYKTVLVEKKIYHKILEFHKNRKTGDYSTMSFTIQDVINKFGENPKCYITGDSINIYEPKTYQFDHIIPVSKGGDNSIENLGICTRQANLAKSDNTFDELLEFCQKVVSLHLNSESSD